MAGEAVPIYTYQEWPGRASPPRARRLNLPAQPTAFIGREIELAEAKRLLANTRLLTFTGPGGIGKTRLALKIAGDMIDQFNDGASFVNLAAIRTPAHIIQIIAEALEFPLSTQEEPDDQLLRYLRNRQFLLVMDNFEHLLDGASVVSKILQAATRVKVLATSREKLELRGETVIGVAGLNFPETGQSDDLLANDAIELFVQSAQRTLPGFELSDTDLAHATHICQMVQGMPLAIELATAWLDTLSFEEIADELRRSLDILSTEMRDVPARHRSIRAAFDHSWSLIDETEREAFMQISVFRGGFTRDAAQHVAGASLELLAALVGKSLVRHDPNRGRFEIHELMRQYAQERLEQSPQARVAVHEAHASYYASFMSSRWDHLRDGRQIAALEEIDADIENVRTAWRYCMDQNDASRLRLFIHSIRLVYTIRGWNYAGFELFSDAVEAIDPAPVDEQAEALRAMALAYQGFFMAWLGLAEQGIDLARQGADTLRRLNRPEDLALALDGLTLCARYLDLHVEFEEASRELLQLAMETDDQWLKSFSLFLASTLAAERRDHVEAGRLAELSLGISEERDDSIVSLYALSVLGAVAFNLGDYGKAKEYYLRFLSTSERVGYRWGIENSSKYLGHVALAMNSFDEAESYFHQSLLIAEEIGLGRDTINLLYEFARVRVAQNLEERAVELLGLVLGHPASRQARFGEGRIQDSAQSLLDTLVEKLPPDTYAAAMQRGKAMKLDEVVAALIEARNSG
jgi:predicted ATPase